MANKIYHESCGQPTEYSTSKPKFCAHCGGSFGQTSVARAAQPVRQEPPKRVFVAVRDDDDDEDFRESSDFTAPRKLEVEVDLQGAGEIVRTPLASIVGQGSGDSWGGREAKKMTKKAVKAKYQEIFTKLNSRTQMRGNGHEE